MSWLKIDDGFMEHPKVMDLSDRALRLHLAGLCFCARNLTDGFLAVRSTKVVCALTNAARRHIVELRDAGLWVACEDGWLIKDYLEYNPDAASVKDLREQRRAAGRRGGIKSGETRRTKGEATKHLLRSKPASNGVEPRPVPSFKGSAVNAKAGGAADEQRLRIAEQIGKSLGEAAA